MNIETMREVTNADLLSMLWEGKEIKKIDKKYYEDQASEYTVFKVIDYSRANLFTVQLRNKEHNIETFETRADSAEEARKIARNKYKGSGYSIFSVLRLYPFETSRVKIKM